MTAAILGLLLARDPGLGDLWKPFQMRDTAGQTVSWTPGRVTVFSVCAYWCDTWKQQVPRLVESRHALEGLPVDFVTVSTDGRCAEVARNNGGLPLWRDAAGEWSRQVGITRVPTTVVVDRKGKIVFEYGGIVRREALQDAVQKALRNEAAAGGPVYLTFDDFPPPNGGEELLDALRGAGVKATFFCLGSKVRASAALLRRGLREGHSVQCHSWSHDAENPQLERCHREFRSVLGIDFRYYRSPGGERIVGLEKQLPVVDPYDYTRPGRTELMRRVLSAARPGCEIQLHAGVMDTTEALPTLIEKLRERGFSFERF